MPDKTKGSGIVGSKSHLSLEEPASLKFNTLGSKSGETYTTGAQVAVKHPRREESPSPERSGIEPVSQTTITSEEVGVLLHQLTFNVQAIKAMIHVLVADCEAQSELAIPSRSNRKVCRTCKYGWSGSACEDPMEGSQNMDCFWLESSLGIEIEGSQDPYSSC
ncbi:hypothetical protein BDN67DRAFT_1015140 [Paxillus ammoniavirescens]|nr:hypothetical protein BDN67DRAFT_1015140 [Paxillus ammoniavirescens]